MTSRATSSEEIDKAIAVRHPPIVSAHRTVPDLRRIVANDGQADIRRERRAELRYDLPNSVCYFDRIGAGDLRHLDRYGARFVLERRGARLGGAVDDSAQVSNSDWYAVTHHDDNVGERKAPYSTVSDYFSARHATLSRGLPHFRAPCRDTARD